ncbi:MAG: hypothetical protein ABI626_10295 [Sphingomicrobium sp.]
MLDFDPNRFETYMDVVDFGAAASCGAEGSGEALRVGDRGG